MRNKRKVTIDPEFAELLPATTQAEDTDLERSVRFTKGPLEPLKVWKETGILLDGHRRLDICRLHGLEYETRDMSFASREAALAWMREWQVSRRNLNPKDARLVRAQMVRDRALEGMSTTQAAKDVAEELGVSPREIERDRALAEIVDDMPEPVAKAMLRANSGLSDMRRMADLPKEKQLSIVEHHGGSKEDMSMAVVTATDAKQKPKQIKAYRGDPDRHIRNVNKALELLKEVYKMVPKLPIRTREREQELRFRLKSADTVIREELEAFRRHAKEQ